MVAAEVKTLARQTAEAADEIAAKLGALQAGARDTAATVDGIAGSIAGTRAIGLAIGDAVDAQASATGDISFSADLAARRTRDCADTMAAIRAGAGHTHEAIARVMVAAETLTGTNDAVARHVQRFADDVRRV